MYGLSPVFKVIAASSDATLSGLVLTDASSNAITLTPTFVATTKSYTASVTNDEEEITIVPTVNDSSANYEIQDGDGNVLTDSDSNVGDLQVDLDVGDNTVTVEVTAEDTTTTETYQVVITRTMAATATEIPASWSLKPTGLSAGDEFRLIFLSSTKRNANSTNIARLQHLHPEPGHGWPRRHPDLQFRLHGGRLHPRHRCPRQHQHHRHRRSYLLAEWSQDRHRLRGLLRWRMG